MKREIQRFNNFIFNHKKIDSTETILIVGSPRSGTTWILEILGVSLGYTNIFEPLNPMWYPESYEAGFRSRTYVPINSTWKEGEDYLKKVFSGGIANLPIKDNAIADLLPGFSIKNVIRHYFAHKLLVKSVNMNRMLPWISDSFQLRKIFFIIRHPCATIASQLKSGLYGYRSDSPPYHDIFPTKKDVIAELSEIDDIDDATKMKLDNIKTPEEILAAIWCLDNYILLKKQRHPWEVVMYEKLIKNKEEIKRLFECIFEKNIPKSAYRQFNKPSAVTLKDDQQIVNKSDQQLSKWKTTLSGKQVENILKITSYFNMDFYNKQSEPDYDEINF